MEKVRIGIIGCGRISKNHVNGIAKNSDTAALVSTCDLIEEKASRRAKDYESMVDSKVTVYTDYRKMLDEEILDLVVVATESGHHARISIDVLKSGRHVIVEKPMALSIDDANEMIAEAKRAKKILIVSHQNRFNKAIQTTRAALEDGRFGRLFNGAAVIRWNRNYSYYNMAPWRGTWAMDGGALMNQCIHNIDLLRWMMGDGIDEVFAYTANMNHPYVEGEDIGTALIRFSNGSFGTIEGNVNVFPKNLEETLSIFGENGTVVIGGIAVNKILTWRFADGSDDKEKILKEHIEDPPNIYGFGHVALYKDAIESIKDEKKPYVDGEAGKKAVELVLAIYKSSREHKPVKLPLSHFSTLDMKDQKDKDNFLSV